MQNLEQLFLDEIINRNEYSQQINHFPLTAYGMIEKCKNFFYDRVYLKILRDTVYFVEDR
jgi:hypothetical protein